MTGDEVTKELKVKEGQKRNFLSNRAVEAWNMVLEVIKRSKTVSNFKIAFRRQRVDMVEKRLGRHRDGNQTVAGPHPDPDTFYGTLRYLGHWT